MDLHALKIEFLEEFLKIKDEAVVKKLFTTLKRETKKSQGKSVMDFVGILTEEEAKIFQEASDECRKIDLNEW